MGCCRVGLSEWEEGYGWGAEGYTVDSFETWGCQLISKSYWEIGRTLDVDVDVQPVSMFNSDLMTSASICVKSRAATAPPALWPSPERQL